MLKLKEVEQQQEDFGEKNENRCSFWRFGTHRRNGCQFLQTAPAGYRRHAGSEQQKGIASGLSGHPQLSALRQT